MRVSVPMTAYVCAWVSCCAAASVIAFRDRARLRPELEAYARSMAAPWKVALFVPAFLFVTFAGRFTDDETWDVVTGSGMSILAFATAPWAAGVLWRFREGDRPVRDAFLALVVTLFSSSWFYDGYLLWRDGAYSDRWWANLIVSTIIYAAAGATWSFETAASGEPSFAFLRRTWPRAEGDPVGWRATVPIGGACLLVALILVNSVHWRV